MQKIIQKIFGIQEGDGLNAFLMFSYIFFIIASLLIVKPVRNSLFITQFGVEKLPYAFISVAFFAAIIIKIYSAYVNKIRLNLLIAFSTVISIISLIFFLILLKLNYQAGWFYFAFYIWVALFGAITTSQFWLLANYVFNSREAKRLFGFVGAGAITGGIFGGYLTNFLAPVIGTDNMIFFCIFFLGICLFLLKLVWKKSARFHYSARRAQEKRIIKEYSNDNPVKLIFKSRHLAYLAAIIGISVIVANLVDYQFSAIACDIIKDEDRLTAFFGFWLSNLSIASLVVQLFLTGRILKLLGVTASLFFLPVGILIGALAVLFMPALWSAILVKVSDGSFKQSINKAGLELLALPIPTQIKNQAKAFIDVFIDSLATGIGGILIIFFVSKLGFTNQYISLIILLFIALWIYFISKVRNEYIDSFRLALEKRSINLDEQNINLEDAAVSDTLIHVLEGENDRQILYVLQLLENVKNDMFVPHLQKLIYHHSSEIKMQALKMIKQYSNVDFSNEVYELIKDSDFDVKVEAVCYLFYKDKTGKELVQDLLKHSDYKVRSAALICIALEYRANSEFRNSIDLQMLFDQFIDQCCNEDILEEQVNFMKINLAKVIGIAANPSLYKFLDNLLNDPNAEIVKAAIISAGKTCNSIFISKLIQYLKISTLRNYAYEALVEYGENIVENLSNYLINSETDRDIRYRIPLVLASIGCQESVDVLMKFLEQKDIMLRYQTIRALNRLKNNFPELKFDKKSIKSYVTEETKQYYIILSLLHHQNRLRPKINGKSNGIESVQKLLIRAIEEKLDFNLERIFRLLGLQYPRNDIYNSYLGIKSKKSDLQANAIEFLDNVLDVNLKRIIIPIVEEKSHEVLINKSLGFFNIDVTTAEESIEYLLTNNDNWLKVCALHFVTKLELKQYKGIIKNLLSDPDPTVKETAQYYFKQVFPEEV